MRSVGTDLEPLVRQGLLLFQAARPTLYGLERHLVEIHKAVRDFQPQVVVVDPVTNFLSVGTGADVKSLLLRLFDFLKVQQITLLVTSLTHGAETGETDVGISSLIDTWLLLRQVEVEGERKRQLSVVKSRGMDHSRRTHELVFSERGIKLLGPLQPSGEGR